MAEIDGKIVGALERVSQAFRVLLRKKGKSNALSPIQVQILIFLLFQSGERCNVTALAQQFDLTKATISDSVKSLLEKHLIQKCVVANDNRSYMVELTVKGKKLAMESANFTAELEKPLNALSGQQKEMIYTGLLQVILGLHRTNVISIQKMCFTCSHYGQNGNGHYCNLLHITLDNQALQLDCPEHRMS